MQLRQYLEDHKIAIPAFADRIGVTVQAVHRYVSRERTPRREVMERITAETAGLVQANDFYAPSEPLPVTVGAV